MQYRREIDGLRAVAVLPVIFFHAGFTIFQGGFVGVDVFFVISGYLITTIILTEQEAGRFSVLTFYERRARRILPALFAVMLACLPFAWAWMLPSQLEDFSKSVVAVTLFVSNILFWSQNDYFGAEAEEKPLLHTWSLAVEEQYYMFFPLLVVLLWGLGRRRLAYVIAGLALASLALSEFAAQHYPRANFFLAPSRVWELFAGSLCAFWLTRRPQLDSEILAGLGLVLIVGSILFFGEATPFPSLYALAPVLGTVLIILFGGRRTRVGRLLALKPVVGIGLISYSIYLWHQPLFAFGRIRSSYDPSLALLLGLCAASILLAALSWRLVEQPFRVRRDKSLAASYRALGRAAAGGLVFLALGAVGATRGGALLSADRDSIRGSIEANAAPAFGLDMQCAAYEAVRLLPECQTAAAPEILVWGDSYAMHLIDGILASNPEARIIQMTMARCGPFLGLAPHIGSLGLTWSRQCLAFNRGVLDWLAATPSVKHVVLSSPFLAYVSEGWHMLTEENELVESTPERSLQALEATLARIEAMGKRAVVFAPPPQSGANLGRCLATSAWLHEDLAVCDFSPARLADITRRVVAFLRQIEARHRVVWLAEGICDAETCMASRNGAFLYHDHGHLSRTGSRVLGREMRFYDLIVSGS